MDDVLDRKRAMCLLQIIETGTVRGAAEVLELDPSVVSRAVAKLEQDTGLTLLERRGRGVVATDAGRLLALFARRQQDLNDTFLAEVNNLKNARRGHVELVFGEGFVDHYVRTRDWEVRQSARAVTDWELRRYFEAV